MEVFHSEVWAIGLTLDVAIEKSEPFQNHGVKAVAGFSNSQTTM
jgi:hypothetical protein